MSDLNRRELLRLGVGTVAIPHVASMLRHLSVAVPPAEPSHLLPTFTPSTHGWPFRNFGDFGNCGGMCWSALDRFLSRTTIPRNLNLSEDLRDEIADRQRDTLDDWLMAKVEKWTVRPDQGHVLRGHSVSYMTRDEWPKTKKSLDQGIPISLCLIREEGYSAPAWKNHQVLAYRYARNGDRVTIWVYDSNSPGNDSATVAFDLGSGPLNGSQSNSSSRMRGCFPVSYDRDLNVHVHLMNGDGSVGPKVDHRAWSDGWTSAEPYVAAGAPYLLILKRKNGLVHQHTLDPHGSIGKMVEAHDWTSGWTSVCSYEVGGKSWVLMLKQSGEGDDGNNVHIHPVGAGGELGPRQYQYDWSAGWTTARVFVTQGKPYLFLMKLGDGSVHIQALNDDGSVGPRVDTQDWGLGWSNVCFYTVSGNTYLFVGSAGPLPNGNARVYKIKTDGTIGPRVYASGWSLGWTEAEAFEVDGQAFLGILKTASGVAKILRIASDGTIGATVASYDWSSNWSTLKFYRTSGKTYMFLLKSKQSADHGGIFDFDVPFV